MGDTVTHNDSNSKTGVTFMWNPPTEDIGDISLTYVSGISMYFYNIAPSLSHQIKIYSEYSKKNEILLNQIKYRNTLLWERTPHGVSYIKT